MSNQSWKIAETIGVEQAQAMDEILALLDAAVPEKFIAMFGTRNSASVLLNDLLGKNLQRTPGHRKLMGVMIDATRLPTNIEAWQHMIFALLDKLGEAASTPQRMIGDLRDELNELISLERRRDPSATLASAAFAAHFRKAFPGLVSAAIGATNSLLVLGLDKLDQVDGVFAMDLLEASRYFLNSHDCATLAAADEKPLIERLQATSADAARLIVTWPTERVVVPEKVLTRSAKTPLRPGAANPATANRRANLGALPNESAKVIKELLEPDQRAIDVACGEWLSANAQLTRKIDDGSMVRVTGAHLAKLIALKTMSKRLFDAAKLDAGLLARLERAARSGSVDMKDELLRTMAMTPKLTALFKSAPNFVHIENREVATALRLVYRHDNAPAPQPAPAAPQPASRTQRSALNASASEAFAEVRARPRALPSMNLRFPPLALFAATGAAAFMLDRLAKSAADVTAVYPNMTTSSLVGNATMLGIELLGLALSVLIMLFWGVQRRSKLYHVGFGLIVAGLSSNLLDHIRTGGVLNFLPIGGLALNLAHLAMFAGAALILASMLQREPDFSTEQP
jgi:lipoprotein signal peptidase